MRFINIRKAKKLSPSVKSALAESETNPPKNTVGILFGYADDLIGLATREISTPLNLQYDTVHNLPKALTFYGELQLHKEGKTTSEARVSIAKALSSYLYLLAANCHNMPIEGFTLNKDDRKNLPVVTFSGGITFLVGDKTKIDFYDVCREAINAFADEDGTELTTVFPELIDVAYYTATNVDLYEKGFKYPIILR